MSIFDDINAELETALNTLELGALDTAKVTIELPRDASHGDLSTNAAMVLSKQAGKNPRELAEKIAEALKNSHKIQSAEIAGPGFINLRLDPNCYFAEVSKVLDSGLNYGSANIGNGHNVCVEYVSANPTGPLHVGHTRGSIVGDTLCNLLEKAGYSVTREYYVNDAGGQIDTLARSAHIRYREALGEVIDEIPEGLYPGDYLKPTGQALAEKFGNQYKDAPESAWLEKFRDFCTEEMMNLIRADLERLNIKHDVFSSEKAFTEAGKVDEAVKALDNLGYVYQGTLPPPKGKEVEDWEPVELMLFKSSEFGDDEDRVLKKRDGTWTYTTPDIAYHWDKFKRGHDILITVVGTDHIGWVKRIKAGTAAVTEGKADFEPMLCAIVNLLKDGKPFKLSKRAGNIITVADVVDEVGPDVLRFIMMTRKNDQTLDFDLAKVLEASKDNPVFYVQYAHARICSVMRHAAEIFNDSEITDQALKSVDLSPLTSDADIEMIKALANWPRLVEQAATAFEPHRIAFFLQDLAAAFHAYWNKGKDDATLRFLIEDNKELTLARLALIRAVATTIASGLSVMGVKPLEELRSSEEEIDEQAAE